MPAQKWIIQRGFPEAVRSQAAELYFDAFGGKLGGVLGRDGRGLRFLEKILKPEFALCALTPNKDRLLGIRACLV